MQFLPDGPAFTPSFPFCSSTLRVSIYQQNLLIAQGTYPVDGYSVFKVLDHFWSLLLLEKKRKSQREFFIFLKNYLRIQSLKRCHLLIHLLKYESQQKKTDGLSIGLV